ncbi:ankyrin-1-like [Argiope bruennichi]|uniref:ankyrin-1-like n=1 Tax=Argiope bruennichi TaxID=94029 RepID=UPI002494B225|nr:ankyrin-1-like [Argiope bruennichi]
MSIVARYIYRDQNLDVIRAIFARGIDLNFQYDFGLTLFHDVVNIPEDNIAIIQEFIRAGADVNISTFLDFAPLHFAVIHRKRRVMDALIQSRAFVNAQTFRGTTSLHFAVTKSIFFFPTIENITLPDIWIINKLLSHEDIDCNLVDSNGDSSLMVAVKDRQTEAVVKLLHHKADPNIPNKDGETALHVAFAQLPSDIELQLLIAGANIYSVDKMGQTPIDILINYGLDFRSNEWNILLSKRSIVLKDILDKFHMYTCFETFCDLNHISRLLDEGMDPNHQFYGGTTLFHLECMIPAPNIEVVRWFIQAGADINLENHMGYTPLHFAVIQRKRLVVKELIEHGALINAQNYLGMSALHFAVSDYTWTGTSIQDHKHLDMWIVKELLKHEYIDRDLLNSNGDTPLMLSVKKYHIELVEQLLRSKANPNICNKDFQTPLHVAFSHPPSCIVIELLIRGANIYAVDRNGNTPLDILMNTFYDENKEWVCELFAREMNTKHQFYGGTTPFRWACMSPAHNIEVVRCMIQAGADINLANHLGYAPLHFTEFIHAGADVNISTFLDFAPLHFAVIHRKRRVMDALIQSRAFVNAQTFLGTTSLHIAVTKSIFFFPTIENITLPDIWIINKLLSHEDIDCNLVDSNGDSSLMVAVKDQQTEAVVKLLHHKADPNIPNKDGVTPLHVAFAQLPSDIELQLLLAGANIYSVDKMGQTPMDILINYGLDFRSNEWAKESPDVSEVETVQE